jgi:predicted GIY-YIG superfamily endonuclease
MRRKPSGYWTKERCGEVASLCNSRSEFRLKYISAYNNSWEFGWLDEICTHMNIAGNLRKRLVYSYEFSDNYVYVGITCNMNRRNKQHFEIGGAVFEHIHESKLLPINKILSDGIVDVENACELESFWVNKYLIDGWNILNKIKTGGLGGNILKWDKINYSKVAILCETRKEFSIRFVSAYINARKNGWLDDICSHMISRRKPKNYWDFDSCRDAAKKYNTRYDFSHKCSGAYFVSKKNNWLDIFYPKY